MDPLGSGCFQYFLLFFDTNPFFKLVNISKIYSSHLITRFRRGDISISLVLIHFRQTGLGKKKQKRKKIHLLHE